jgi:hypothetical protein
MVDLLRGLHAEGRYARIVVVAHSLGAFIAYDGITSLWMEYADDEQTPGLHGALGEAVANVERCAAALLARSVSGEQPAELDRYRERQFELWQAARAAGHPWLITDFVSIGTPMYFADLLYTRDRAEFDRLVLRGELPQNPPLTNTRTVESERQPSAELRYSYPVNAPRSRLTSGVPFAVVRWANLYFPAERGFFGDWFGGPLQPLFGRGIKDVPVLGNQPGRRAPGLAHGRYFTFPDDEDPSGIAAVLQRELALHLEDELVVPPPTEAGDAAMPALGSASEP